MEQIIKDMIGASYKHHDYELAGYVWRILYKCNAREDIPIHWQNLGAELAMEYQGNDWIMKNCGLNSFV